MKFLYNIFLEYFLGPKSFSMVWVHGRGLKLDFAWLPWVTLLKQLQLLSLFPPSPPSSSLTSYQGLCSASYQELVAPPYYFPPSGSQVFHKSCHLSIVQQWKFKVIPIVRLKLSLFRHNQIIETDIKSLLCKILPLNIRIFRVFHQSWSSI